MRQAVRRLVVNILLGNGDAHLKNFSLIYRDPKKPDLAPAYDIVSTIQYMPGDTTPRKDINLIVHRLAAARRHDAQQGGTR